MSGWFIKPDTRILNVIWKNEMNTKPKLFIGSSKESLQIAETLKKLLSETVDVNDLPPLVVPKAVRV
jgi:hypothetical protein